MVVLSTSRTISIMHDTFTMPTAARPVEEEEHSPRAPTRHSACAQDWAAGRALPQRCSRASARSHRALGRWAGGVSAGTKSALNCPRSKNARLPPRTHQYVMFAGLAVSPQASTAAAQRMLDAILVCRVRRAARRPSLSGRPGARLYPAPCHMGTPVCMPAVFTAPATVLAARRPDA